MADTEVPSDKFQIIEEESSKMDDKTVKLISVCVILANVLAVVALILAFVGVVKNGNQYYINSDGTGSYGSSGSSDDKIWLFQIGHFGSNTQYLHEMSGTIRGYDVDITNAICQVANKNCRLVWDLYERCWDSQAGQRARGGIGLMGSSWYDACIGWYNTRDRARTYAFSTPFEKSLGPKFFVKSGNTFDWPNFAGKMIGYLDGWWIDEHCLSRYETNGFEVESITQNIHYQTEELIIAALVNGQIQVAFLPDIANLNDQTEIEAVYTPTSDRCSLGGPGLMVAKDQFELLTWWNSAFESLLATSEYREICNNLDELHGAQPGADPGDVCVS